METHDHNACIHGALAKAERLCAERGVRLTPTRRQVLQLVLESHQAAKAYDLLDRLKPTLKGATPMTIYRALQFLQDQGLVHRVETLNAFVGCTHEGTHHPDTLVMLICESCQQIEEHSIPALRAVLREAMVECGFERHRETLEVYGACQACQSASALSH